MLLGGADLRVKYKVAVLLSNHEWVAVLEGVHSQRVWGCRAEVPHGQRLLHLFHTQFTFLYISFLVLIKLISHINLILPIDRVEHHVSDVLTTRPQESKTIYLKLMRVSHQVDAFSLMLSNLWKDATIERLLRHERVAEVLLSRHHIHVDSLTKTV